VISNASNTTALVTGAAGFIGSHVVDGCLDLGMRVVATDDLSGGYRENISEHAQFIVGDLRDPEFAARLWKDQTFDYVYHLGAYAAEGLSHFVRAFNYRTNLEASVNLINQAIRHGLERFVFTSSIAVYGRGQVPMTEEMTPVPEDPYGISKYAVELDLAAAANMFGLDYTIFRPHNVYGERQNIADKYRNVIGIFMNAVLRDEPMRIFGDGLQTRAFSHVADVAPIISRSPLVEGSCNEVFNIGADRPYTVLELAREVANAFDAEPWIEYEPVRNEVLHAYSDHRKVREAFDLPPTIDLHEGIGRMATWVGEHGPRDPVEFPGPIEIRRNLPPSWRGTAEGVAAYRSKG
jgi:UDP-glucose 4-epimerase